MSNQSAAASDALVAEWLQCPPATLRAWFETHQQVVDLAFIEKLKMVSDAKRRTAEDARCNQITEGLLAMASWLPTEPLAQPLAAWARGNWLIDYDPKQAMDLYQQAIAGFQPTNDALTLVRLFTNLLGAALEIDPSIAFTAYAEIKAREGQLSSADHTYLLIAELNYGVLLQRAGQLEEAVTAQQRALALAEALHDAQSASDIRVNLALTFADQGKFADCERMLQESRMTASESDQQATVARIDMDLGMLYTILGRPADALRALERARQHFTSSQNAMELGSVSLREADLFERLGALRQAHRAYKAAQEHFATREMWPQVGVALVQGALALRLDHEFAQATRWLTKAEVLWSTQQHSYWLARIQLERVALALAENQLALAQEQLADARITALADQTTPGLAAQAQLLAAIVDQRQGELADQPADQQHYYRQATVAYQAVLAYSQQQGEHQLQRQALAGLAQLAWPADPRQAFQLVEQALHQDEMMRTALSLQELKASFLHKTNELLLQLVAWSSELQQPEQMLRYSWRAKGAALLDLFSAAAERQGGAAGEVIGQAAMLESLRQQLAQLRWQAALQSTAAGELEATVEQQNPAIYALEEKLLAHRRRQNYEVAALIHWEAIAPGALVTAAGADLLIEYICLNEQLIAITVDQQGCCRQFQVAAVDEVRDIQDELHFAIRNALWQFAQQKRISAALYQECQLLLAALYDLLLAPVAGLAQHHRLLIAPCDALHKVPFAALWHAGTYLIETHQLEQIYTGALLIKAPPAAPSAAPSAAPTPIVIGASADGQLPTIGQEVATIQRHFPAATCFLDQRDALGYLRAQATGPAFVHLAAHTLERHDNPLFTALRLAQAMLSVEECYELPLQGTAVVTLSSCKTNTGMESAGALLAFQSAMLVAGAQRVISTLWEIHGAFSVPWMDRFYGDLAQGRSPAHAWRQTQLACLAEPSLSHPALWAAFVCNRR